MSNKEVVKRFRGRFNNNLIRLRDVNIVLRDEFIQLAGKDIDFKYWIDHTSDAALEELFALCDERTPQWFRNHLLTEMRRKGI